MSAIGPKQTSLVAPHMSAFGGPHPELVTFYFLARYTGQRRSDLVNMKWTDIDNGRGEMFVAQAKTKAKIWVPMPQRLARSSRHAAAHVRLHRHVKQDRTAMARDLADQ
jgi:integrase